MKRTLAILCLFAATAVAAEPPPPPAAGISYLSGGIGLDEREALRSRAGEFNLRLFFAEKGSGHYVAGVRTHILRPGGEPLLAVDAAGPWLYVAVPAGKYRVVAEAEGREQSQTVTVGVGRPREVHFYWP